MRHSSSCQEGRIAEETKVREELCQLQNSRHLRPGGQEEETVPKYVHRNRTAIKLNLKFSLGAFLFFQHRIIADMISRSCMG